jgi:hypothetical protein
MSRCGLGRRNRKMPRDESYEELREAVRRGDDGALRRLHEFHVRRAFGEEAAAAYHDQSAGQSTGQGGADHVV